jgi:integrase
MAERRKWPAGIESFRGRFRVRLMVGGRRIQRMTDLSAVRANLPKAVAALEQARQELLQETPGGLFSFTAACEAFLEWSASNRKPHTSRTHGGRLASLCHYFDGRPIASLAPVDIEDYITWRRSANIAEATIRGNLHTLSAMLRFARRREWIQSDPLAGIEIPSDAASRRERVITSEEEAAYLASAARWPELHDLAVLIVETGVRPDCEGLKIRPSHVNLPRRRLYIPRSKSATSERTLVLSDAAAAVLQPRLDGEWCFPGKRRDGHLSYSGVVNTHYLAIKASGVDHFDLYDLRHAFATRFYDSTRDIVATSQALGHSNLKTVMRYVKRTQQRLESAMELFVTKSVTKLPPQ